MSEFVQYFFHKFWVGQFWAGSSVAFNLHCNSDTSPAGVSNYLLGCPMKLLWLGIFSTTSKFLLAVDSFSLGANAVVVISLLLEKMPGLPRCNSKSHTKSLWKPHIHLSLVSVLQSGLSQMIKIRICWISVQMTMCKIPQLGMSVVMQCAGSSAWVLQEKTQMA